MIPFDTFFFYAYLSISLRIIMFAKQMIPFSVVLSSFLFFWPGANHFFYIYVALLYSNIQIHIQNDSYQIDLLFPTKIIHSMSINGQKLNVSIVESELLYY